MKRTVIWSAIAWDQYMMWYSKDRKTIKKINDLIKDIDRNGLLNGIGKPEPLKYEKACSRRIDDANRLVYNFDDKQNLIIFSCEGHYD